MLHAHGGGAHRLTGPTVAVAETGAAPPTVQAPLGAALASVAAARPVPQPAPGVSTEDPRLRVRPERVEPERPRAWVAAQLLLDGRPVAGIPLRVELPGGGIRTMQTAADGTIHVDGVWPGRAAVTPDSRAWPPPPPPPADTGYVPDVDEYDV